MAGPWENYAAPAADDGPWAKYAAPEAPPERSRARETFEGALRGAAGIGNTLLTPVRALANAAGSNPVADYLNSSVQAQGQLDAQNKESNYYGGGKLAAEIGMTLPVGGAIAQGLRAVPGMARMAPSLLDAIGSAGMRAGGATGANALAARTAGGAITGGATAGLVDPQNAGAGAMIGGALPGALKLAGLAGNAAGAGARAAGRAIVGDVSPEVAALAKRAEQLGIKIPADRIADSKPLNAAAASLNYVPFSGRAATEDAMQASMNKALSRTFGQNSENVTMALRRASSDLGAKFDAVLQNNTVKMSPAFRSALADAENQATSELGPEAASIIHKQIAQLQTKGATGQIEGQAAYNIKKALDRIGSGNTDAAFYARDLKKRLMDALNESLGPQQAAAFGEVRKQYGNMLALENLAANGAEGGVSVGRLANLKHINNPDLQELADIAAQFLKTRENPHGALQRLVIGGTAAGAAGGLGALPMLPVAAAVGRGANAALNSATVKNALMGVQGQPNALQRLMTNPDLVQAGYRAAPLVGQ